MASLQFQDHYIILDVQPTTALNEIKAAYRLLAFKHHPDKNNGAQDATVMFQRVSL
jgi:molecular chaperone DnaJ